MDCHLSSAEVYTTVSLALHKKAKSIRVGEVVEFIETMIVEMRHHPVDAKKIAEIESDKPHRFYSDVYEVGVNAFLAKVAELGKVYPDGVVVQDIGEFTKNGTDVWEVVHEKKMAETK
jgi:hypothetical protein